MFAGAMTSSLSLSRHFQESVSALCTLVQEATAECHQSGSQAELTRYSYEIRIYLRNIQGLLSREDFTLPPCNEANGNASPPSSTASDEGHSDFRLEEPGTERGISDNSEYHRTISAMISLLVVDYDVVGDATLANLYRDSIIRRAYTFLESVVSFTPAQLREILYNILHLFQVSNEGAYQEDMVLPLLLELFAHHVQWHEQLHQLQLSDQDVLVALYEALSYHRLKFQRGKPGKTTPRSSLATGVLIQSLMGYLINVCMPSQNTTEHERKGSEDQATGACKFSSSALKSWLRRQFEQQHEHAAVEVLKRKVGVFMDLIHGFGNHLILHALRLIEHTTSLVEVNETDLEDPCTSNEDLDKVELSIIKHGILAADFLTNVPGWTNNPTISQNTNGPSLKPSSRVLWREFAGFMARGLTIYADDATVHTGVTVNTEGLPALSHSAMSVNVLWALARLHYPVVPLANNKKPPAGTDEDVPMILSTILGLWKHANEYWNEDFSLWIEMILQYSFPKASAGGREIRHAIQAMILSHVLFPCHDQSSFQNEPIEFLAKLVLEDSRSPADPWQNWLQDILNGKSNGE